MQCHILDDLSLTNGTTTLRFGMVGVPDAAQQKHGSPGRTPSVSQTTLTSFTPQLQLETLFVLDQDGRIVSTREPNATAGPAFFLVRDHYACAWAVHREVPAELTRELIALAQTEPPLKALTDAPIHLDLYVERIVGRIDSGPVFTFPPEIAATSGVSVITHLAQLERYFRGWTESELPDRSPIIGVLEDGHAVSVCFCARRTPAAAEAGLETASNFRGRGLGGRTAAAWGRAIWDSGRLPLYSTSWDNVGSLGVARSIKLRPCGSNWSLHR